MWNNILYLLKYQTDRQSSCGGNAKRILAVTTEDLIKKSGQLEG